MSATCPRYDVRKKTAADYPREMWAVCYADTGETLCITGPTDCPDCNAAAKARALASILNRSHSVEMQKARSHA